MRRFLAAFVGEIDVGPARETILLVPRRLTVPEQNQFVHLKTFTETQDHGSTESIIGKPNGFSVSVFQCFRVCCSRQLLDRRSASVLGRGPKLFFNSE